MVKKYVNLMINSTFYDMIAEYDCFINEVFPRLREYCSDKDIEIGFRDVAFSAKELPADDNILLQDFRCIDADRTFFFFFRAQKLGWRPDYTNINRITVQEYPEITSLLAIFQLLNLLSCTHWFLLKDVSTVKLLTCRL